MSNRDLYLHVAPVYDVMSSIWSLKQTPLSKKAAFIRPFLPPGSKVLIVGAGTGADAVHCAQMFPDVNVTVVDFSPAMIRCFEKRKKTVIPDATNKISCC